MAIKLPGPPLTENLKLIETRMLFPRNDLHRPAEIKHDHVKIPEIPKSIDPNNYRVVYSSYGLVDGSYTDVNIFDTAYDVERLPHFNHRQRQLVSFDQPRKRPVEPDDDAVSVASTKSGRSTASEQGTRMRRGEQGFIYMDEVLPRGQEQGWGEKERWEGSGTWNEGGYNAYPPQGGGEYGGHPQWSRGGFGGGNPRGGGGFGGGRPRGGGGFGNGRPRGGGGFGGGRPRGGGAFRGGGDRNHNGRPRRDGVFHAPRSLYLCYT
jgi:hypothetical protein